MVEMAFRPVWPSSDPGWKAAAGAATGLYDHS